MVSATSPVTVVNDRVHDGGHLLGEFWGVGRKLLRRRAAPSLLGLLATLASSPLLVAVSPPLAFFQADLFLHLFQISIFNCLKGGGALQMERSTKSISLLLQVCTALFYNPLGSDLFIPLYLFTIY